MKPNLVPKYNLFGNSALEVGTLPSPQDLDIDRFNMGKYLSFQMTDDNGSIFLLKINLGKSMAKVQFALKVHVSHILIVIQSLILIYLDSGSQKGV